MHFTIEQIDNALRQVIDAQPDFTYTDGSITGCYYHQGPTGAFDKCDGCVFGQAFQLLGIPKETLEMCHGGINSVSYHFLPSAELRPSYWRDIQTAQDHGRAWHTLLEYLPTTK